MKRLESEIAALRRDLTQVDGDVTRSSRDVTRASRDVTRSSRDRASESESEDEFQLALESIPSQRYPALIIGPGISIPRYIL